MPKDEGAVTFSSCDHLSVMHAKDLSGGSCWSVPGEDVVQAYWGIAPKGQNLGGVGAYLHSVLPGAH